MGLKMKGRAMLRLGLGIAVGLAGIAVASPINAGATGGGGPIPVSVMGTGDPTTLNLMQGLDFLYLYSPGCNGIAPSGTTQWLDFSCQSPDPAGTITTENYQHDQVHQTVAAAGAPADPSDLGITELCQVTRPVGVDYARSSHGPKAGDCAGLKYVSYAVNAFNVYCTALCPGGASSTATVNYVNEDTGWLCKPAASHAVNPVTGNNFRTDIQAAITAAGYTPLPQGAVGGGDATSTFCRLQGVSAFSAQAGNTSAFVSWAAYTPRTGDPALTGYTVTTSTTGTGTGSGSTAVPASATSATITGLTNSLAEPSKAGYTISVAPSFGAGSGGAISQLVFPQVVVGQYTPVTPARVLDTRPAPNNVGQCTPSPCATLANTAVKVQIAGQGGIPASGVNSVVMNVAVTGPTAAGYVKVWPSDAAEPNASNLNFNSGQTIANLVTVKLGADGAVNVRNLPYSGTSTADLISDVAGWYADGTPTPAPGPPIAVAGARYSPLTPARILDTRPAPNGPIGVCNGGTNPCSTVNNTAPNNGIVRVQVSGQGGVPVGASAVVMDLAVTNASANSFLRIWPSDSAEPNASVLNFNAGQTIPNLVTVKLGADGAVFIHNFSGSTDIIGDVFGNYAQVGGITGTRFTPVAPVRILDSRTGISIGSCNGGACSTFNTNPVTVQVAGQGAGGVPASGATGVVMNVAVVNPSTGSFMRVWPSGAEPNASNLNYNAGDIIPNLVSVKLSSGGAVQVHNIAGTVDVISDVAGWFNDGTS